VESLVNQVRWTVATLVAPPTSSLAPAVLRGDELVPIVDSSQPATLLFETDDIDINFIIQEEPDKTITLTGQILTDVAITEGEIKIAMQGPTTLPRTVPVSDVGEFTIESLVPGTYQLFISLTDQIIAIPNLVLDYVHIR